jgi:hypothetical protein
MKSLRRVLVLSIMAVALTLVVPGVAQAQEDCTSRCWQGTWIPDLMGCDMLRPNGGCATCDVVCPGDGTGGPYEPDQDRP